MTVNTKEIRKFLIDAEISQKQIALDCRVSEGWVSLVISGRREDQRVLDRLHFLGCPKKFLGQEAA